MSAFTKDSIQVTNKNKFKAILKLNGLDNKKLAEHIQNNMHTYNRARL